MANQPVTVPYPGAGNPIFDALSNTAKAVFTATQAVSCPLYRDFPAFMTGSDIGSPAAAANDSFLNQLCNPTGNLPPAPTAPFTGGQCECVSYRVQGTITGFGIGTQPFDLFANGPIGSIVNNKQGGDDNRYGFFAGSDLCGGRAFVGVIQSALDGTVVIGSVVRQDGTPDTCGDPSPAYPIVEPSAGDLNVSIPIQFSPNFNVLVPVNVFAPVRLFAPSLRIGPFNVDFDLGGLTISPDFNVDFPAFSPTGRPGTQPPAGQRPADRAEKCNLDEVMKFLRRIRECQECDRDYDFLQTGFVTGRSGSLIVPIGGIPLTVGLEVIQKPSNSKEQPGLTEPNVVYAGWGWFSGNGFREERGPIDADLKLFQASEKPSPNQFSFTCQAGYVARATLTYKRLKNPLPPV